MTTEELNNYYNKADKKVQFYVTQHEFEGLTKISKSDDRTLSYTCRKLVKEAIVKFLSEENEKKENKKEGK